MYEFAQDWCDEFCCAVMETKQPKSSKYMLNLAKAGVAMKKTTAIGLTVTCVLFAFFVRPSLAGN